MTRTPSTLEIVWGIHLLLVVIILFRPTVGMGWRRLREYPVSPFRPLCRNIRESSLDAHAFVRMFVELVLSAAITSGFRLER